ncbi:MAG: DUF4097 domain-containing protein [Aestuariibacter sp.]
MNIANIAHTSIRASLLAVILGWSGLSQAIVIEKEFTVANGGTLDLRTDVGALDIRTHDKETIEMEVDIRGEREDEFEVTYKVSGDDLDVVGELENRRKWGNGLRVHFFLTVPENYDLELQTSGGSISISDLQGDIDAKTSGGSISIGDVRGDVELHTSGGSISTENIYGEIDAHTSGGSVTVRFAEQIKKNASLSTSGGSITAYLPADIKVDLNASTSGGQVRSDFDVNGRIKKNSIKGEINGGGPELSLRTSGGSVKVKRR